MNNEKLKALSAVLTATGIVCFLVLSGWMHVEAGTGGGTISNQAPTVETGPTGTIVTKTNAETASELFTGTVKDKNGEIDIAFVNLTSLGPGDTEGPLVFSNDTTANITLTAAPISGPGINQDGITVWNETSADGFLHFSARRTFNASCTAGTYTQWLNVTDDSHQTVSASETTTITTYTHVTWQVVFRNNTNDTSGIWAFSNATQTINAESINVNSTNWLRAYSDGVGDVTSLSIQFNNFTNDIGVAAGYGTINLTTGNNMKFRYNSTTASMNDTANTIFNGSAVNGSISGADAGGALAVGMYRYFEYLILDVSNFPAGNVLYMGTYSGTVTAA